MSPPTSCYRVLISADDYLLVDIWPNRLYTQGSEIPLINAGLVRLCLCWRIFQFHLNMDTWLLLDAPVRRKAALVASSPPQELDVRVKVALKISDVHWPKQRMRALISAQTQIMMRFNHCLSIKATLYEIMVKGNEAMSRLVLLSGSWGKSSGLLSRWTGFDHQCRL